MTKEAFENIADGLKEALEVVRSGALDDRFEYLSAEPSGCDHCGSTNDECLWWENNHDGSAPCKLNGK